MRLFGITINTNTDVIALSAFLLGALSTVSQVSLWLVVFVKGADLTLFQPEQVLFRAERFEPGKAHYLRLGARAAYVNSGASGYNAMIANEYIHLAFPDRQVLSQKWQAFKTFDIEGESLAVTERQAANPFPVIAGNAAAHDTYFVPFRKNCEDASRYPDCSQWDNYWKWDRFLAAMDQNDSVTVTLEAEVYGGEPETVTCIVTIDANVRDRLRENLWHSPSCRPVEDNHD